VVQPGLETSDMSEIERLRTMGVEVDSVAVDKMNDPMWTVKSGLGYQHLSDDSVYLSRHRALSEARDFTKRVQLIDWMKQAIRPVFPFECGLLVFGTSEDSLITVQHALSIDMPASYMTYVEQPNRKMRSPLLSTKHERHAALAMSAADIGLNPNYQDWHKQFIRAGFKDVVIDGIHDDVSNEVTLIKLYNCASYTSTGTSFALSLFETKIASCVHNTWKRIAVHEENVRLRLPNGIELLTPKEIEVLRWIKQGKTNLEIGIILNNSPKTIKTHVEHILSKLNMPNRATLASIVVEPLD
jgi:DNA-binding CsgD family transcriptional regulator